MKSSNDSRQPPNEPPSSAEPFEALIACRNDSEFLSAVRAVLDEAELLASPKGQVCLGGGVCCRFDLAGFRLYLTTGEMALLSNIEAPDMANVTKGRCPYQVGPRCTAREVRPLGCRTHFCRKGPAGDKAIAGNEGLYEDMHARIRRLHDQSGHPYAYRDLLDWFCEL